MRRALATPVVGLLAVLILLPAGCESDEGPTEITGYWLWSRQVEDGQVVLEITDDDMEILVGPSGWPDCPSGIICTRYGIQKVAFGDTGRIHFVHNVHTSSDFQTIGTYTASGGVGQVSKEARFSCAHPDQDNTNTDTVDFVYRLQDGELWIGVSRFGGSTLPFTGTPDSQPTRWMVYRPISREDYYGRYMIRVCQPTGGHECHEGCTDDDLEH